MKTTRSVALLGLVLLSCLSDVVIAQQRASCSIYHFSGKKHNPCPRNYDPVCGTDDMTYPNECFLCKEIFDKRAVDKKYHGRCVECSQSNCRNTELDCSEYLRSVSGGILCTLEYMPICGTDGVTYTNTCNFCSAVMSGRDVNLSHVGECVQIDCNDPMTLLCTADYNPLCGSNGKTYGNKCQFCRAFSQSQGTLFLKHRGEC